jgi:hypothetical protein
VVRRHEQERSGLAWFKAGTLNLKGMREDLRKGGAFDMEEDITHTLLK